MMGKKNKKENTNKKSGWKKLLYTLVTIFVIILILFSVTRDILRDYNTSNNNRKKTPIDYLEEDYDPYSLLSSNHIKSNDINDLITMLENAGVYAFTSKSLSSNYFSETQTYPANTSFSLKDHEVGAFFNAYLNASRQDESHFVSVKELSIKEIPDVEDKFKMKIVVELNLENILNLTLNSTNNLKKTSISTTCEIVIQNRKLNFLNGSKVKINDLNEEKNNAVIEFINSSASISGKNIKIEKFIPKYFCDFINEFLIKSSTALELKLGGMNFNC